jgi:hypothetical protein
VTDASGHPYRRGVEETRQIIVTTGNEVAAHRVVQYLGIVRGIVVRSPSIGNSIFGSFKALGGGNINEFTEVCEAARHEAYEARRCCSRPHRPEPRCAADAAAGPRSRLDRACRRLRCRRCGVR